MPELAWKGKGCLSYSTNPTSLGFVLYHFFSIYLTLIYFFLLVRTMIFVED